jgi:two-component system OmpR family sensor kinase
VYEESVIKLSEKESLLKSFSLFFLVIELFLGFIFYHYYRIEKEHASENLFLEMKNYSLSFKDKRFDIDIVPKKPESRFYELYIGKDNLYILVPFPDDPNDLLKIYYPKSAYLHQLEQIQIRLFWQFLLLTFIAIFISLLFSFYVLKPIRHSLQMLEMFIKDIIHDLNTPLTSILINLKMMDSKNEEVESISRSAKTIAMLHQNLDAYLKEQVNESERFKLDETVQEQVVFFQSMYDYLTWKVAVSSMVLKTDKHALGRILYNLLSNACKYNTANGFIHIRTHGHILTVSNSSYGITSPERIFERFYKESDRGLGIGLHIVKKLCDQLHIPITLEMEKHIVHFHLDLSQVTSK